MSTEHLTEEQIALCADAMAMEEFSRITPSMRAHLAECDQCSEKVNTVSILVRKIYFWVFESAEFKFVGLEMRFERNKEKRFSNFRNHISSPKSQNHNPI